ncbi:MAG: hypothetical protein ACOYNN_15005 [Terrimicrobiaceae bacterium]
MYKSKHNRSLYKHSKVKRYEVGGIVKEVREDYPPEVVSWLKQHGDEKITSLKVGRTPVSGIVKGVLNVLSLGALNKAVKKAGIDSLFHLYLIVNDKYRLEKNQLITFGNYRPQGKDEKIVDVPFDKDITIGELVDNGVKKMGKLDFFTYGAFGNRNCQGFIMRLLQGSGIKPPTDFIKQDVETIVENVPSYVPKIANAITDLAGALDLLKQKARKLLPFEEGGVIM